MYAALGLDPDEAEWYDFSVCNGQKIWRFYEGYESSTRVAIQTDQMCLSCPVRNQCLQYGMENNEWGVWGGIYLSNGKVDHNKNSHKTPEVWLEIKEGLS